jgi:hypothetical protein
MPKKYQVHLVKIERLIFENRDPRHGQYFGSKVVKNDRNGMFAALLEFLEIENIYSKHAIRKSVPLSTSLCLYFNYVTIRCL